MTRRSAACALALVLAASVPVDGHQLDEYLQATRLSIARNRIVVDLTLTPGVSIAPRVFAAIDRDGDGRVSPPEIQDYARRVLEDLSLTLDGRRRPLALVRSESASWDEIQQGAGTIRVLAEAEAPALAPGAHLVRYENAHESASGVYLVNALAPSDTTIDIRSQRRDRMQHFIELNVDMGGATHALSALAALAILAGALAVRTGFRGFPRAA